MNDHSPPGIGHNLPPGPTIPEALLAKVADFSAAAGNWMDLGQIDSDERSQRATDFIKGSKELWGLIDAERKRQKKPHDDLAQAVQDLFAPYLSRMKIAFERVGVMQTKYLQAKRQALDEARRAEAVEARRKADEAARAMAAAEARGDVVGIVDAMAQEKAAAKAVLSAEKPAVARAESATGGARAMSIRTAWFADVENIAVAFVTYRKHPDLRATLERLATADVRALPGEKVAPPGFTLRKEEKAV